jgi:hypothetical protein
LSGIEASTESRRPQAAPAGRWLLLIHQLPPKPDYLRVKVRRRLRRLGALPLKNSVYVLPASGEAREDFEWLARAIEADGGEASVCEATFLAGVTDAELRRRFGWADPAPAPAAAAGPDAVRPGRTWVTRSAVGVDRLASAWLIRRFIDPRARFRFVEPRRYRHRAGELRFDMFDGEYTHAGDRCTFETLLQRFALAERALAAIGEIVHDIDCKDQRFGRAETAGVATLVHGITIAAASDAARVARATAVWDDLYAHFAKRRR